MARMSYQYETSPRKYEPEYTTRRKTTKKVEGRKKISSNTENTKASKKEDIKRRLERERAKKLEDRKRKTRQVILVIAIFGMLLSVSYREISVMEMFNQKKELENQLAVIEKENGQVEKSIKEVESTLDWNKIKQKATDELGMESKQAIPVNLEKTDNVETDTQFIQKEETSWLEKIISFLINR